MNLEPGAAAIHEEMTAMVEEFQTAMGQEPDLQLAKTLILEEAQEVVDAALKWSDDITPENAEAFLKEVADHFYVLAGAYNMATKLGTPNEAIELDEDQRMIVLQATHVTGEALQLGIIDDEAVVDAVRIVHASNMSKLGEDGKPVRREDGKITKGPNYRPADLTGYGEEMCERLEHIKMLAMIQSIMEAA